MGRAEEFSGILSKTPYLEWVQLFQSIRVSISFLDELFYFIEEGASKIKLEK